MSLGKTIRVYLDNGSVSGIKHAEIINWTGQAIFVPRNLIKNLSSWEESQRPGIYFLFGKNENDNDQVYIGETSNIFNRLKNHLSDNKKDFFTEVIFITSKDDYLTKGHVEYLESRLLKIAEESNRYIIDNPNGTNKGILPRSDIDAMEEYLNYIRILTGVLSHKVLEPITTKFQMENKNNNKTLNDKKLNEFKVKSKNLNAVGILTDEGIVVKEGSLASKTEADKIPLAYKRLRQILIERNILIENKNHLYFKEDYLFSSPSQAGSVITGYSVNGRTLWTKDGKTLKEYEENQIEEETVQS